MKHFSKFGNTLICTDIIRYVLFTPPDKKESMGTIEFHLARNLPEKVTASLSADVYTVGNPMDGIFDDEVIACPGTQKDFDSISSALCSGAPFNC